MKYQFLHAGKIGDHTASLDLPAGHVVRDSGRRVQRLTPVQARQLGDHSSVNTAENIGMLLWREFVFRVKRDHMWSGMLTTDIAGRVRMTRPQRVIVLCATSFTSLAVGAFLFSNEPFRVTRLVQTGVLSAMAMIPPSVIIPFLFRKVRR